MILVVVDNTTDTIQDKVSLVADEGVTGAATDDEEEAMVTVFQLKSM